jgi:hypothetical protein
LDDGSAAGHRPGVGLSVAPLELLHAVLLDLSVDLRGGQRLLLLDGPRLLGPCLLNHRSAAGQRQPADATGHGSAAGDAFGSVAGTVPRSGSQ